MSSAEALPGITGIGQVAVTVANLEDAKAFYRDVLGLPLLFEVPGMTFFKVGGVRLLIGLARGDDAEEPHPSHVIYYAVADIVAAYQAMKARGAVFIQEPHVVHNTDDSELWLAFFRDVDGVTHALMSEVEHG